MKKNLKNYFYHIVIIVMFLGLIYQGILYYSLYQRDQISDFLNSQAHLHWAVEYTLEYLEGNKDFDNCQIKVETYEAFDYLTSQNTVFQDSNNIRRFMSDLRHIVDYYDQLNNNSVNDDENIKRYIELLEEFTNTIESPYELSDDLTGKLFFLRDKTEEYEFMLNKFIRDGDWDINIIY